MKLIQVKFEAALELLQLMLLKFSSLALTASVLLFLTVAGGLKEVGIYSSATAVTAPIATFLIFRSVEWISMSESYAKAFSIATVFAAGSFLLASPVVYLILEKWVQDFLFLKLILLYKPLEIISDMLMIVYTASGNKRLALYSIYSKFSLAAALTFIFIRISHISPLRSAAFALLIAFFAVILCYDWRNIRQKKLYASMEAKEVFAYVKGNIGYGFLSMAVSVNSSMPRYFLISQSDMSKLGLFSLLYQLAATLVNILQYPISIKVAKVSGFIKSHAVEIKKYVSSLMLIFVMAAVVAMAAYHGEKDIFMMREFRWVLYPAIICLMFVFLLIRGIMVTAVIGLRKGDMLYAIIIGSIVLSALMSTLFLEFSGKWAGIVTCGLYVILSSSITTWLLLNRVIRSECVVTQNA
jgi:hypothetical protein